MGLMDKQAISTLTNHINKLYPVERYSLYRGYSKERNEWIFGNLVTERYNPSPIGFSGDIVQCYNAYIVRRDVKYGADWGLSYPTERIFVEKKSVGFYTQCFDDRNVPMFEKDLIVDCKDNGDTTYIPFSQGRILFKRGEFVVEHLEADGKSSGIPYESLNSFVFTSISNGRSLICISYPETYVLSKEFIKKE